jgi:hypothetical protein
VSGRRQASKVSQLGTLRIKQGPSRDSFSTNASGPARQAVKPEAPSRVYIGAGINTIGDSRYAFSAKRAASD